MKKTKPGVLQYAFVKAYSLTDFKKFVFSGNRYFLQTGENQQVIWIVFASKGVFMGYFTQAFRKIQPVFETYPGLESE
jgi:hypothetical protein